MAQFIQFSRQFAQASPMTSSQGTRRAYRPILNQNLMIKNQTSGKTQLGTPQFGAVLTCIGVCCGLPLLACIVSAIACCGKK